MLVTGISSKRNVRKTRASGEAFVFAVIPTAWGYCGAIWKNHEDESANCFAERPLGSLLCRLMTPGHSPSALRAQMLKFPSCTEVFGDSRGTFHPEVVPEWFPELVRFLQGFYSAAVGERSRPHSGDNWSFWSARLDWSRVTPFQRQVLETTGNIPSGQTLTYGQVAKKIGKPAASRAVGMALGANPWPVVVPCHRVIGTSGKLTGFSAPGGIETKRRMLELEAR